MKIDKEHEIYLACPYSTPKSDGDYMQKRYELVTRAAGILMCRGYRVMSPITMGHAIASMTSEIPREWEYWEKVCKWQLGSCKHMLVLMLEGWHESTGVSNEVRFAKENGIPVTYITMDDLIEYSE